MLVSPYFVQFSSFAQFSMLVYDDRQLGRVPVAQCMYQPPLCLFQSSNGSSFRHSDFPPTSHSAKCHNKFTPSSFNATEDNATMILFRRIPQTPFFPVFSWSNWFCCCSWKLLCCCVGKQCKMVIDQDACLDRLTDSLSWSSIREGLSQRHFPIVITFPKQWHRWRSSRPLFQESCWAFFWRCTIKSMMKDKMFYSNQIPFDYLCSWPQVNLCCNGWKVNLVEPWNFLRYLISASRLPSIMLSTLCLDGNQRK